MKNTLIIIWLFCNSLVLTCQNNFDGTLVITDHLRNGMHLISQKDSSFINYQFESNHIKIFDYDKNDASFLAAKSTKVERAGCKLHFNDLVRVELTGRINKYGVLLNPNYHFIHDLILAPNGSNYLIHNKIRVDNDNLTSNFKHTSIELQDKFGGTPSNVWKFLDDRKYNFHKSSFNSDGSQVVYTQYESEYLNICTSSKINRVSLYNCNSRKDIKCNFIGYNVAFCLEDSSFIFMRQRKMGTEICLYNRFNEAITEIISSNDKLEILEYILNPERNIVAIKANELLDNKIKYTKLLLYNLKTHKLIPCHYKLESSLEDILWIN